MVATNHKWVQVGTFPQVEMEVFEMWQVWLRNSFKFNLILINFNSHIC